MKRPCPWERLYHTKRWERRAALQRKQFPLCAMCLKKNIVTPMDVADHIIPHRGDLNLFYYGELQSLCHTHHSSTKALAERGITKEYIDGIGNDGWPIDPLHPVYGGTPIQK
jgi:5-methylcytosine-specific restriction endonuclease McrA